MENGDGVRLVVTGPEAIRKRLGYSQAKFARLLHMPRRTYEDKIRREGGFTTVDLYAAKWVYLKETQGSEL